MWGQGLQRSGAKANKLKKNLFISFLICCGNLHKCDQKTAAACGLQVNLHKLRGRRDEQERERRVEDRGRRVESRVCRLWQ